MTGYEFSLFLHITAVMVGFGSTFAESVLFPIAMKMSPRNLPYVHRLQLTINQFFALPALVIVIATGLYQMAEGNWEYGDLWVSGTLTIVVVIGVLLLAYFIPADRRLLPMIEEEAAAAGSGDFKPSEAYMKAARNEGIAGTITGILLVVAVFLMVTKPGL